MLFHSFYLAIVRMHTKEKMICSFSCHSTSLMSLSTLVEIYTLLCHEAEGELIYDSRNFICIYTEQTTGYLRHPIYDSRNFICIYTGIVADTTDELIYDSRNLYVFTPQGSHRPDGSHIYDSRNLYVFTPYDCKITDFK